MRPILLVLALALCCTRCQTPCRKGCPAKTYKAVADTSMAPSPAFVAYIMAKELETERRARMAYRMASRVR